ncbi:hypothetical protein BH10PSE5_BH10PSE5_06380 [soil metagenome]
MRRVWILAAAAVLASCSPKAKTGAEAKYAGLDEAILAWRQQIVKTDKACSAKADGCQSFEVGCKGEREITPIDQAKGVTAKLVVAMSWEGWDPKRSEYHPESGFAEFTKVDGGWLRGTTGPVNLSTCVSS